MWLSVVVCMCVFMRGKVSESCVSVCGGLCHVCLRPAPPTEEEIKQGAATRHDQTLLVRLKGCSIRPQKAVNQVNKGGEGSSLHLCPPKPNQASQKGTTTTRAARHRQELQDRQRTSTTTRHDS